MDLSKLTLEELLDYERAAHIICSRYEKSSSTYMMDINKENQYTEEQKMFLKANEIYKKIINEMEKRVWQIL